MSPLNEERVLSVRHWNDSLFSFTTTRSMGFRFRSGQFVMVGLEVDSSPLMRAFSMVSACYDEHLEFYSIKIPDGALTSRLRHIAPGDRVFVSRKPTGTLLVENLRPGRRLCLLATGTGLAPFLSIIRDPETYQRFDRVVLAHGVRRVSDLGYRTYIEHELGRHELVGKEAKHQLVYYPTVTREPFAQRGRLTELLHSGRLFSDLALPPLDPEHDRVMICGSPSALKDIGALLEGRGFDRETSASRGGYLIERAFVEK